MNEQLQQALAQVIEKATDGVQSGVSFLSAELPDVIHQLLMWKMIESLIWCVVGIIFIVGSIRWIVKNSGKGKEDGGNYKVTLTHDERGDIAPRIPILMIPLITIVAVASSTINITWLQILIAPKVYLIEYAASLVK